MSILRLGPIDCSLLTCITTTRALPPARACVGETLPSGGGKSCGLSELTLACKMGKNQELIKLAYRSAMTPLSTFISINTFNPTLLSYQEEVTLGFKSSN